MMWHTLVRVWLGLGTNTTRLGLVAIVILTLVRQEQRRRLVSGIGEQMFTEETTVLFPVTFYS